MDLYHYNAHSVPKVPWSRWAFEQCSIPHATSGAQWACIPTGNKYRETPVARGLAYDTSKTLVNTARICKFLSLREDTSRTFGVYHEETQKNNCEKKSVYSHRHSSEKNKQLCFMATDWNPTLGIDVYINKFNKGAHKPVFPGRINYIVVNYHSKRRNNMSIPGYQAGFWEWSYQ